jgi:hypothetical protein
MYNIQTNTYVLFLVSNIYHFDFFINLLVLFKTNFIIIIYLNYNVIYYII